MIERKFIPGTEWLYLKIYTGVKTSDIILEEMIKPLVEHFQENNFISKWFFIRYHDPKHHIRVRFKLTNLDNYNKVLKSIKNALEDYIDSGEISNIIIDSYVQKIERYGKSTIENAEELFFKSSELILNFLEFDDEEKLMVSMFYIDQFLSEIKLPDREKLKWIDDYNAAFKKEFRANKNLNSQLDKKFRIFKSKYLNFVNSDEFTEIKDMIITNLTQSDNDLEKVMEHNNDSLSRFFQSIFHMHINRIFISEQRVFEMIIYDYLFRYYKSALHNKN